MKTPSASPAIELRGVTKRFGGLTALANVSFDVPDGSITGLIGPNGAGKTTAFNLISGLDDPTHGSITYAGSSASRPGAVTVATEHQVGRTFQNIRLFQKMSVIDNVRVGRYLQTKAGLVSSVVKYPWVRREERESATRARELLDLVGLSHRGSEPAGSLSYGEQRRVEVARALAMEPRCLLLDEPAAGFTEHETEELGELIRQIRQLGITILLIEHKMGLVMDVCDKVVVLNFGAVIAQGSPSAIQTNPAVIDAYLGRESHAGS